MSPLITPTPGAPLLPAGQMSAAMVVVDADRRDEAWAGTRVSPRVDRHAAPLDELAALLDASAAFEAYNQALDALMGGRPDKSLDLIDAALATLPGEENFEFLRAGALAASGRADEATRTLRALVAARPSWAAVARSAAAKGMLALPADLDADAILRNL
jgi:predicted Zn-dependent protease